MHVLTRHKLQVQWAECAFVLLPDSTKKLACPQSSILYLTFSDHTKRILLKYLNSEPEPICSSCRYFCPLPSYFSFSSKVEIRSLISRMAWCYSFLFSRLVTNKIIKAEVRNTGDPEKSVSAPNIRNRGSLEALTELIFLTLKLSQGTGIENSIPFCIFKTW